MLSCHEVVPSQRVSRDWRHPAEIETSERDAIWVQHMHEHPTLMHIMKKGDGQARMVSDFLGQSHYHRLGLYNEASPRQAAGYRFLLWPVIPCLTRNPVWPSGYRLPPV